jgi:RNA polymerase sigma factor (sigma-70 family)
MQDHEIIKLCIEGKKEYFELLVDRYQRLVYSMALHYLKDPQFAEDASQEAFVKAYTHLARYNPQYRFSTWIARITANTCADMLRKRKETSPIDAVPEIADPDISPEEKAIARELKKKTEEMIGKLDDKYRIPLMLYHVSGLKYEEIAEYLKVPMSIVKNRIFRARKMLREEMEGFR